jgi:ABC-type protease/lipase transport system fused ATPase/permease subunit
VVTALPVVGMLITIAEGPNPFGFLLPLSAPALYLLDALDRFLPIPKVDNWSLLTLVLLGNLLLYFLMGYLMDYTLNRYENRLQLWFSKVLDSSNRE